MTNGVFSTRQNMLTGKRTEGITNEYVTLPFVFALTNMSNANGHSYKHSSIVNYDSKFVVTRNCLYYDYGVKIYGCRPFVKLAT